MKAGIKFTTKDLTLPPIMWGIPWLSGSVWAQGSFLRMSISQSPPTEREQDSSWWWMSLSQKVHLRPQSVLSSLLIYLRSRSLFQRLRGQRSLSPHLWVLDFTPLSMTWLRWRGTRMYKTGETAKDLQSQLKKSSIQSYLKKWNRPSWGRPKKTFLERMRNWLRNSSQARSSDDPSLIPLNYLRLYTLPNL
jgi:hypothetical protein